VKYRTGEATEQPNEVAQKKDKKSTKSAHIKIECKQTIKTTEEVAETPGETSKPSLFPKQVVPIIEEKKLEPMTKAERNKMKKRAKRKARK